MKVKTAAKINLNLSIQNSTDSKLHKLDSLIVPIDLYDEIDIHIANENRDNIVFTNNDNLSKESTIHKALACLRGNTDLTNFFNIRIDKGIPIEAGLGGGSSDAAAVLVSIEKMLDLQLPDYLVIANEVGSDVPFFINGKPAKVKNIGDKVEDYFIEKEIFFLIILPNFGLSTKNVFNQWDILKKGSLETEKHKIFDSIEVFNDASHAAFYLEPRLKEMKELIEEELETNIFLTGTGSTLFAVFDNKEDAHLCKEKLVIDNCSTLVTKKIDYSYKALSD
tara:strand:- start:18179 stop:19015 length:837 start_codon:yes stop_codon:yes gene_type:complete